MVTTAKKDVHGLFAWYGSFLSSGFCRSIFPFLFPCYFGLSVLDVGVVAFFVVQSLGSGFEFQAIDLGFGLRRLGSIKGKRGVGESGSGERLCLEGEIYACWV